MYILKIIYFKKEYRDPSCETNYFYVVITNGITTEFPTLAYHNRYLA